MKTKPAQDKATPRPWKVGEQAFATIYAPEGFIVASTHDGINHDIPHRANAALIVEAVNNIDRWKAIEKAARYAISKWSALQELARPEDLCLAEPGDCDEDFDKLSQALASTPEQARQSAQRQAKYVKALEAVAESAFNAKEDGYSEAQHDALCEALANLEAIRNAK